MGPKTILVVSSTASTSLLQKANKASSLVHSFRDGLPDVKSTDICVVMTPCVQNDYENAKRLAEMCKAVILVNGYAKVCHRVPLLHSLSLAISHI
jgi:hypothetical protein